MDQFRLLVIEVPDLRQALRAFVIEACGRLSVPNQHPLFPVTWMSLNRQKTITMFITWLTPVIYIYIYYIYIYMYMYWYNLLVGLEG